MYKVNYIAIGATIPLFYSIEKASPEFAIVKAEELMSKHKSLFIVGFKFFETTQDGYEEISGNYFLCGKVYTYPQIDDSCKELFKQVSTDYSIGKSMIIIKEPYPNIFPYDTEKDSVLNYSKMVLSLHESELDIELGAIYELIRDKQAELEQTINMIDKYSGVGDNDVTDEIKLKRFRIGNNLLNIINEMKELY